MHKSLHKGMAAVGVFIVANLPGHKSFHEGSVTAIVKVGPHRAEFVHAKATPPLPMRS